MKNFASKFKLIFIPYLLITIGTVCLYSLFNWAFFIKTNFFAVDEEIINLFIPMGIPGVPILIWLRPRIKLLNLTSKNRRSDPLMGYSTLAWFAIAMPTIIAQQYIVTATGKLTKLDHVTQISNAPETKYYEIKHHYIDKRLVRFKTYFKVSGKYNADFNMAIYAPCPIFDKDDATDTVGFNLQHKVSINKKVLVVLDGKIINYDQIAKIDLKTIKSVDVLKGRSATAYYGAAGENGVILIQTKDMRFRSDINAHPSFNVSNQPVAWLAICYKKTISNHLSDAEKEASYRKFAEESQSDFNGKNFDDFVYLDRVPPSSDLNHYTAAIRTKDNASTGPLTILLPVNEPFEARNGNKLEWIFGSLGIGSVVFLISLLFKPLKSNYDQPNVNVKKQPFKISKQAIFIPHKGFYFTPVIMDINLLVFIVMVFSGLGLISFDAVDLLKWGGNYRPYINDGQYWRLITNMFLHGGLMHVLFNMFGLLNVGIFLEPILGGKKYIAAYFVTGIIASIASVWWHPATVSVGASGAIFGMYGVFLALLTTNLLPKDFKKSFLTSTLIFVGYNLLYGLTGGIDNAAHIGGLLSGLICGYVMYPFLKKETSINSESEVEAF